MALFRVEYFLNGVLQGDAQGNANTAFSTATILLGNGSGSTTPAARTRFDDISVVRADDGVELVGNAGFESALGPLNDRTFKVNGNWSFIWPERTTAYGRQTALPAHGGAAYGEWHKPSTSGSYYIQDLDLGSGQHFDFQGWVYRHDADTDPSGYTQFDIMFDWDRGGGDVSGLASIVMRDGSTSFSAWGIGQTGLPPVPYDEWVHVRLRVTTYQGCEPGELLDTFWVNSRNSAVTTGNFYLASGITYRVVVDGNYDVWGNDTTLIGSPQPIKYPAPGDEVTMASLDADTQFAIASSYSPSGLPQHNSAFQLDPGDGLGLRHIEASGGPTSSPSSGHEYTFWVTGANKRLRAWIYDSPHVDNSGQLRVRVYCGGTVGWHIGQIVMG